MLTDKNLLILPGRHQYVCAGAEMRIWLSCFLSKGWQSFSELEYLDQKMKFGSPLRLATYIPLIQRELNSRWRTASHRRIQNSVA